MYIRAPNAPVVFDGVAAAEEDHHLLLEVALEEGKEEPETGVGWNNAVPLLQIVGGRLLAAVVHTDVQRLLQR